MSGNFHSENVRSPVPSPKAWTGFAKPSCQQENSGLPCRNIADCWFHLLDVVEFLEANYREEQREALLKRSKPGK